MLTERLSDAAVNSQVNALALLLSGGILALYDGAQPATCDTPITSQVRLARLVFAAPAFGAGVAGVAETPAALTPDADAAATGIATWYRCFQSDDATAVQDGSVGKNGFAPDGVTPEPGAVYNLTLNSPAIAQHAEVVVDGFTLTASKA